MDAAEQLGCPPRLGSLIQQLYDMNHVSMPAQVLEADSIAGSLAATQAFKQGCVPSPIFLTLYLTGVLEFSPPDLRKGVYIKTRFDGKLFNLKLKSKAK